MYKELNDSEIVTSAADEQEPVYQKRNRDAIVSLSGGLDSTTVAVLAILSGKYDRVSFVYTNWTNLDSLKSMVEKHSVEKLLENLEQLSRISKPRTIVDSITTEVPYLGNPSRHGFCQPQIWMTSLSYIASNYLTNIGSDDGHLLDVCLGYVPSDSIIPYISAVGHLWQSLWALSNIRTDGKIITMPNLKFPILDKKWSKQDCIDYLKSVSEQVGIDFMQHVWYCESPRVERTTSSYAVVPCGACTPCTTAATLEW